MWHPWMLSKGSFCPLLPWTEGLAFLILQMWPSRVTDSMGGAVLPPGAQGTVSGQAWHGVGVP